MDILIASLLIVNTGLTLLLLLRKNKVPEIPVAPLAEQVEKLEKSLKEEFRYFREEFRNTARENREEHGNMFSRNMQSFLALQKERFAEMDQRQRELVQNTEKRLEEIRATVDEKLQKTLHERIGQSFEMVGKQLEHVQKGLGEMHHLAQDVGGLKKVLSNVKMRGNIGEIQLEMLLEQVLAPEQYDANVKTRKGSDTVVEFAVKLPGKEGGNRCVYLPIDAKFPKDAYEQLLEAYESDDPGRIEAASKNIESTIKTMGKEIREKYLDPPFTTDFGIMFLPFESIYAEVVRRSQLMEQLQRDYKVIVTGPTTLAAILNSLQMGFRTLAIQKRSSEVWRVLGAVKTEFTKFGGLLEKAQKNIQTAGNQIEEVMGKRTRAIQRRLNTVEALPPSEIGLLPDDAEMPDEETEITTP